MPRIRTDDGPRKLRAVWLGPKGATLPFEWTFVQWGVTIAVAVVTIAAMIGLWWLLTEDVLLAAVLGVCWGAAGGVYLAVKLMRGVTFDEPVRYKTLRVRGQLGWRDQTSVPDSLMIEWDTPRLGELSPVVAERLGWAVHHGDR